MGERRPLADARTGQRGAGLGVRGLAGQDPGDHPTAVPADEVGAEQSHGALVVRRSLVAPGADDIGVRGPQFAHHLAQQIGELVRGGDPVQQRPVLRQYRVPVDAAHLRLPEVRPGDPARLLERLVPLRHRIDIVQDAPQVQEDRGVAVRLFGRRYRTQLALVVDDQPGAVAAERELVEGAGEFGAPRLGQVEVFEGGPARGVGRVGEGLAQRAGDRPAQPDQPAAADRLQGGVLGRRHGERGDAVLQPLHLHQHGPLARRRRNLVRVQTARRGPSLRGEREGGGGRRRQRYEIGAAAQRERQIAGVHVVDRVEAAPGQERQIAAVAGEDRLLVLEAAVGDVQDVPVGQPGHLDLPQRPADARVRPGQPAGVGGERQVADRSVGGADQLGDLAGGRLLLARALLRPGHVPGGQPARFARRARPRQVGDLDGVLALGIRDIGDPAGGAEHCGEPDAYARGVVDRAGGAVAMGEPVQAAAYADRAGPAGGVHRERGDMRGRRDLVGPPAGPRAAQAHGQLARYGVRAQIVDQPELAGALVDDARAVAGGVPGVEVGVVGVPAQIGAVGQTGVDVADALVVGEEGDPAADEHHRVEVPAQVRQQPGAVQPHAAHRAAPVALPGGGLVRRLSAQQQGAALPFEVRDRDVGDRPPGQLAAGAAVGGHAVGPRVVRERLAVRGDREDMGLALVVGG